MASVCQCLCLSADFIIAPWLSFPSQCARHFWCILFLCTLCANSNTRSHNTQIIINNWWMNETDPASIGKKKQFWYCMCAVCAVHKASRIGINKSFWKSLLPYSIMTCVWERELWGCTATVAVGVGNHLRIMSMRHFACLIKIPLPPLNHHQQQQQRLQSLQWHQH